MLMKGKKPRKFEYIPRLYKIDIDSEAPKKTGFKIQRREFGNNRGISLYKIFIPMILILITMYYLKYL